MIIVSDFMVGVGLSLSDLDLLTIGMVNELYAESSNGYGGSYICSSTVLS